MRRYTHLRGWSGGLRVAIESPAPEKGKARETRMQSFAGNCKAEAGPARAEEPLPPLATTRHHLPPPRPNLLGSKPRKNDATSASRRPQTISSNIAWKIPKLARKMSYMSPGRPTRATKTASETPNLGLQASKMTSKTIKSQSTILTAHQKCKRPRYSCLSTSQKLSSKIDPRTETTTSRWPS